MKKKKLSEVAVNAATLNGQVPDYYNFRPYGVGASTNDQTTKIEDYNTTIDTGFYTGLSNAANAPTNGTCTLLQIKRSSNYITQIAFSTSAASLIYTRVKQAEIWSSWKKITITDL